ncbi:hypothetical protein ONZ45_g15036 [Pleurotus djamor]|nr:hypothetical protein ONZ45_g15036 [Pleurotus djamor]
MSRFSTTYPPSTIGYPLRTQLHHQAHPHRNLSHPARASSNAPRVFHPRGLTARALAFLLRPALRYKSAGRHTPIVTYVTQDHLQSLLPPALSISHTTLRFAAVHLSSEPFGRSSCIYASYRNRFNLLNISTSYPLFAWDWKVMETEYWLLGSLKFKLKQIRGMLVVDSVPMKLWTRRYCDQPDSTTLTCPSLPARISSLPHGVLQHELSTTSLRRTCQLKEYGFRLPHHLQPPSHQLWSSSAIHLCTTRIFQFWAPKDARTSSNPPPDITSRSSLLFIPQRVA